MTLEAFFKFWIKFSMPYFSSGGTAFFNTKRILKTNLAFTPQFNYLRWCSPSQVWHILFHLPATNRCLKHNWRTTTHQCKSPWTWGGTGSSKHPLSIPKRHSSLTRVGQTDRQADTPHVSPELCASQAAPTNNVGFANCHGNDVFLYKWQQDSK